MIISPSGYGTKAIGTRRPNSGVSKQVLVRIAFSFQRRRADHPIACETSPLGFFTSTAAKPTLQAVSSATLHEHPIERASVPHSTRDLTSVRTGTTRRIPDVRSSLAVRFKYQGNPSTGIGGAKPENRTLPRCRCFLNCVAMQMAVDGQGNKGTRFA
jgi:hypothetical protein